MADVCPRCGHRPVDADRCPACAVIIPVYEASLAALRRGPQRATAPSQAAPADVAVAGAGAGDVTASVPAAGAMAPEAQGASPFRRPPPVASPALPDALAVRTLHFHGSGATLFGIQVVNAFLTLLTLGVYYFWGKNRVRTYLLGQTEFDGDRLAYHGTGRELLLGFLRGAALFFVPIAVFNVLPEVWRAPAELRAALSVIGSAVLLLLIPVAMVGARRYRLSRTSWRGIRFSFRGRVRDFVALFVVGGVLTSLSLGLYYPVFITQRHAFMVSHSWFGTAKFDFDGRGRDLLRPFLVAVLLFLPTLGLSWFWFAARRQRYFAERTRVGAARFRSTITGWTQARLTLGNALALVATLGLAWPWTVVRSMRYTCRYLSLDGPVDVDAIQQDARAARATGEALATMLDADLGFG